jgi:hypothetical protein
MRHNLCVTEPPKIKNLVWIGSSRRDLKSFPAEVKDVIGYARCIKPRLVAGLRQRSRFADLAAQAFWK